VRKTSEARRESRSLGKSYFAAKIVVVAKLRVGIPRGGAEIVKGLVVYKNLHRRDVGLELCQSRSHFRCNAISDSFGDAILHALRHLFRSGEELVEVPAQATDDILGVERMLRLRSHLKGTVGQVCGHRRTWT
jgi:hypothetical protein